MQKQFLGSEAPTSTAPHDSEFTGKTGKPLEQLQGNQAPIDHYCTGLHLNEDIREGSRQLLGSEAPLSKRPQHGWESYPTQMSDRAIEQSKR